MKWTTASIKALKGKQKFACLTAYDYTTARLVDEAGIQLILVGDSLGMTMLGYENTVPVRMRQMLHHTIAVARGVKNALVVADMPFMSYQESPAQALRNAGRFMKETGCGAVKIEGGAIRVETIRLLVENGIPVLGHIGLTPQSVHAFGGFKVQGKQTGDADKLLADAVALQDAGAFAVVLECVPASLGATITQKLSIPTIGIGAGPGCDGQILVVHDLLGLYPDVTPKFVKQYADLGTQMRDAFAAYRKDVESGGFPTDEHSY